MARGGLGAAPFLQHQRRDALEFGVLLCRPDIAGELQPVAIGVEEIDRAEDGLIEQFESDWTKEQQLEIFALCGTYHTISFVANSARLPNEPFGALFPLSDAGLG